MTYVTPGADGQMEPLLALQYLETRPPIRWWLISETSHKLYEAQRREPLAEIWLD